MSNCLFPAASGYPSCEKRDCIDRHSAACCVDCFCRSYCKDLCPFVVKRREQDEAKKKRRTRL